MSSRRRPLQVNDAVCVVWLRASPATHLALHEAQRAPRVGDHGVVLEVRGDGTEPRYLVEADNGDGEIIWLAEFSQEELEHDGEAR